MVSKIIYLKDNNSKVFVILDAAMNDMMRPALYGAEHQILPVKKNKLKSKKNYEFVGPICESTDKFLSSKVEDPYPVMLINIFYVFVLLIFLRFSISNIQIGKNIEKIGKINL